MIILDDAGRAALNVGDEVLVRYTLTRGLDRDGCFRIFAEDSSTCAKPADIFALLSRPIAVGDKLRGKGCEGSAPYTCLGFTSDGQVVAEYDAGDTTGVTCADASCWEKVA